MKRRDTMDNKKSDFIDEKLNLFLTLYKEFVCDVIFDIEKMFEIKSVKYGDKEIFFGDLSF